MSPAGRAALGEEPLLGSQFGPEGPLPEAIGLGARGA